MKFADALKIELKQAADDTSNHGSDVWRAGEPKWSRRRKKARRGKFKPGAGYAKP